MIRRNDHRTDLIDVPERRVLSITNFELRKVAGDKLSLDGYASTFNQPYQLYGGPAAGGWDEEVDPAAFNVTLREKPDLHLLINHEGMPLARTKSGTLLLSTDKKGLRAQAPNLDRRDPDVQRLEVKMERGDMDEMSFAFRVKQQAWNEDYTHRTLQEVSLHKGDVSVVNFGANPTTSAQLRSLMKQLSALDLAKLSKARRTSKRAATEPDDDPIALAQAVDACLDQAQALFGTVDALTLPEPVQQGFGLITAAEESIDALLELLGGVDPDDDDERGAPQGELAQIRKIQETLAKIIPNSSPVKSRRTLSVADAIKLSN